MDFKTRNLRFGARLVAIPIVWYVIKQSKLESEKTLRVVLIVFPIVLICKAE